MPDLCLPAWFWKNVDKRGPQKDGVRGRCWVWIRGVDSKGYARTSVAPSKKRPAHHFTYEAKFGVIPAGLELDHRCKVRHYVRPSHLRVVTHKQNLSFGDSLNNLKVNGCKTVCPQGHRYTKVNTYVAPSGRYRRCRICAANQRTHYNKRKAA